MRAIGLVLAGGNSNKMQTLSLKRAIAAMPVAGSYRAIDFVLSSMSNSHIQKVAVLTQYNSRSLNEHLSSSKWWDFGRKQGGLYVFTPTITMDNGFWYRGTADAIAQNLSFLKDSHEPYVVIASGGKQTLSSAIPIFIIFPMPLFSSYTERSHNRIIRCQSRNQQEIATNFILCILSKFSFNH